VDYYVAIDGVLGAQGTIVLNYQFGAPPRILEAPLGKSVSAGNDFSLRVVADADINLSYLWKLNGVAIPGATNAELFIARCQASDQGTYSIEVTTPLGTAARAVTVNILDSKTLPSIVLTAPSPATFLVAPTNIQLSADVLAYNAAKVEFFVNGKKLGESLSAPYVVNWSNTKAGKYTLTAKVTDGNRRTAKSAPVKISVLEPVTILRQPLPRAAAPGKTARFTVVAKGSRPLSYQWIFEGAPITNATKSVLSVPNVQADRVGNYSVRVTNPVGSVESNPAVLTLK
jgi:membrane carboxypeptidase/penicillin-binding protein PbpC